MQHNVNFMVEINSFSSDDYRKLSGGLVNTTAMITLGDSDTFVHQSSQQIGREYLAGIYQDREFCESIGVRQVQVDPSKFVRAKIVSEYLAKNSIDHSRILEAQDYSTYGSAIMSFIEGVPGSEILEDHSEYVWDQVGSFVATINQLPHESLANELGFDLLQLTHDNWMTTRFSGLLSRLRLNGVQDTEDTSIALEAYGKLFSKLPPIENRICLTYDDAKPDSLIFAGGGKRKPYIVDMESFTIGHRIIDGIGRALYWGPIREPIKNKQRADFDNKLRVANAYNTQVPDDWRISEDTIDLWCVASELFWLPDVIATHTIAPFLPAAKIHGIRAKLQRFSALSKALYDNNVERAKEITFS